MSFMQNLGFGRQKPPTAVAPDMSYLYSEPDDMGSYAAAAAPMGAVVAGAPEDPKKKKKGLRDKYAQGAAQMAAMFAPQDPIRHHQFSSGSGLLGR